MSSKRTKLVITVIRNHAPNIASRQGTTPTMVPAGNSWLEYAKTGTNARIQYPHNKASESREIVPVPAAHYMSDNKAISFEEEIDSDDSQYQGW